MLRARSLLSRLCLWCAVCAVVGCDGSLPDPAAYPLVVSGDGILTDATGDDQLFRVSLEGTVVPLFSFDVGGTSRPSCSADGESIAFESGRGGSSHTRALWQLEGRRARAVSEEEDGGPLNGWLGSWAPDGRRLVVSQGQFNRSLLLVDSETGAVAPLTGGSVRDDRPQWSPNGRWIAFLSDRAAAEASQVFLIEPDGSGLRQLTSFPRGETLVTATSWGPGPSELTYQTVREDSEAYAVYEYRIVNVETGENLPFPDLGLPPGIRARGMVRWSADGSQAVLPAARYRGEEPVARLLMLYDASTERSSILIEAAGTRGSGFTAAWCAP